MSAIGVGLLQKHRSTTSTLLIFYMCVFIVKTALCFCRNLHKSTWLALSNSYRSLIVLIQAASSVNAVHAWHVKHTITVSGVGLAVAGVLQTKTPQSVLSAAEGTLPFDWSLVGWVRFNVAPQKRESSLCVCEDSACMKLLSDDIRSDRDQL